jgi:hypothetical protein
MQNRRRERLIARSRAGLVLATAMSGWCVWYLTDTYGASASVQNLIFVAPATAVVVLLYLILLAQVAIGRRNGDPAAADDAGGEGQGGMQADDGILRPLALMAFLVAYAFLLPVIGFDVATALLIGAGLIVLGERRPLFVLTYSLGFAGVVVAAFKYMLSLDMPTLVL